MVVAVVVAMELSGEAVVLRTKRPRVARVVVAIYIFLKGERFFGLLSSSLCVVV